MTWGLKAATVSYDGQKALDGVDVELAPGSITAVVGGDGAGKTTLARVLAGLVPLAAGKVRRPERTGFQPETSGVWASLTVAENLSFVAGAYQLDPVVAQKRTSELLEATGLAEARDRLGAHLSGGMRQKLGVAMALLPEPDLLILDEPTTGLDPVSRLEIWALISGAAAGRAVLFTTTYLDEASRASATVALDDGRVLTKQSLDDAIATSPDPGQADNHAGGRTTAASTGTKRHNVIEVTDATRRFSENVAVDGVSLHVGAGEIVGLLGANGAGKTTLMRMVLGLLAPSAGQIAVLGRPAGRADRSAVGYVPQGLGLYRDLTVAENLSFVASTFGVDTPDLEPELAAVADHLVGDLPLGIQRRVAFVAARCHHPAVLVLDEPTSGVGPLGRTGLWETIHQAAGEGVGVLVSTHHMDEATECDRVVVMANGKRVAAGSVDDLIGDLTSVSVSGLGSTSLDRLRDAGLTVLMDGAGWRVVGATTTEVRDLVGPQAIVEPVPASFEEVFVALS